MANCSDITKYGIFDVSKTSREEDLVSSYLKWLNNQETSSSQDASDFSFNFGITLPVKVPVPLTFGIGNAANNANSWSKNLTDYLNSDNAARTRFNQEFSEANSKIVDAWRDCALNKRGLVCWAEQTENPKEILLKIDLRPLTLPMLKTPTLVKIVTSPNVETTEDFKGQSLAAETYSILYKRVGRNWHEAANFGVITSDLNYRDSCSVAAVILETTPGLTGNLVAFWKGNGNANDRLGKYNGIASHGVTYTPGISRQAFNFDGVPE